MCLSIFKQSGDIWDTQIPAHDLIESVSVGRFFELCDAEKVALFGFYFYAGHIMADADCFVDDLVDVFVLPYWRREGCHSGIYSRLG